MSLKNIKLKNKFILTFAFIVVSLGVIIGVNISAIHKVKSLFVTFMDHNVAEFIAFDTMLAQGLQTGQAMRNIILDPENPKAYNNMYKAFDDFEQALASAEMLPLSSKKQEKIQNIKNFWPQLKEIQISMAKDAKTVQLSEQRILLNDKVTPLWRAMKKEILLALTDIKEEFKIQKADTLKQAKQLMIRIIVTSSTIFTIVGLIFLMLSLSITRPIQMFVESLTVLANGDLSKKLHVDRHDEFGILGNAINTVINNLREIIHNVINVSGTLRTASADISASTSEMSQSAQSLFQTAKSSTNSIEVIEKSSVTILDNVRIQADSVDSVTTAVEDINASFQHMFSNMEVQAAAVTQSTSAVEEMSASIKQIADHTDKVKNISEQVASQAKEGNHSVKESVAAMKDIADSSTQITKIISVITGIASQTNLLALNAAIEAARAGDAGKGFAVVADEVRNLAEQSAVAAKEITDLIQTSNQKADKGVALIETLDVSINTMITSIDDVGLLIDEVNIATTEQKRGAEEIEHAMRNLHSVSQEMVASMEEQSRKTNEISSAMQNLSGVSKEINRSIQEQSQDTSEVHQGVQSVNDIASNNMRIAEEISREITDMGEKVVNLDTALTKFTL